MTETQSRAGTFALLRSFPRSVQLLVLNQYGVNTGFYMLVPYLSMHLTGNLGLSLAITGLVLGVRTLSQQGLFLIGGTAADRLGPHRVIIAGCALRSVGFAVFAFGTSVPLLLLASILSGLAGHCSTRPCARTSRSPNRPGGRRRSRCSTFSPKPGPCPGR